MLCAFFEVSDSCKAHPEGFDARFAVVFRAKETAEYGDLLDHFARSIPKSYVRILSQCGYVDWAVTVVCNGIVITGVFYV